MAQVKSQLKTEACAPEKNAGIEWNPLVEPSQSAVMKAVRDCAEVTAQINWLERRRWRRAMVKNLSEEDIIKSCLANEANPEAVKIVLEVAAKETRHIITPEKIQQLTRRAAEPTMRAVSALLAMPYSWRGLNPRRTNRKGTKFGKKYNNLAIPAIANPEILEERAIADAAYRNHATIGAIKLMLPIVQDAFWNKRVISRTEITQITGSEALPVMKALSTLFDIPYSLRGFNPGRINQKGMGARNKPLLWGTELMN